MSFTKKLLLAIGIAFIAIQFVQPAHNKSDHALSTDILKIVNIPDSVNAILKNSCYDCHSNNTVYPWYSNIQPMGWLMANHIKQGKEALNFSEFGSYSPRRQLSKLNAIANSIRDDIMPLSSYKLMHKNAHLSTNKKTIFINWAQQSKDSLSGIN
ncbi:MAG: cytochrome C [Porphyromonadaceae bacterium]|nr:MAG: cytochrome C [Porphyromonadaceae bacterium]